MNKINIKFASDTTVSYIKNNIKTFTKRITDNDDNSWLNDEFKKPIFEEKKYSIDDFDLKINPDSKDKNLDFENHIVIYEHLKDLPRYVLCDERFWLWLELDKFYLYSKKVMTINGVSTIKDHWLFGQGGRRGIFFGILSRCFFRVDCTIDENNEDKYWLTRWVVNNPERFRNLSWRAFSSERHLVRGALKGEKRAVEKVGKEITDAYTEIAKFIVYDLGGTTLLDAYSEADIEKIVYDKMLEILADETVR